MNIGFLIIDMQRGFLSQHMEAYAVPRACEHINYVAELMRNDNQTVIHIQDIEGVLDLEEEDIKIIPEIKVEASDLSIFKKASNAFWNTELETILRDRNINMVIVSGYAAEHCVLFTYNGAIERDFKAVMLQNGILSSHQDMITSNYRDRNMISYPVIEFLLND